MTPTDYIEKCRQQANNLPTDELLDLIIFKEQPIKVWGDLGDLNVEFRDEVSGKLVDDFSENDLELIRLLTNENFKYTRHTTNNNQLSQLCFYLFCLGHREDTFVIYNCKYNSGSMDAGSMVDREMLKMRKQKNEMVNFVKSEIISRPHLKETHPDILENLIDVYDNPDYESDEAYFDFQKGYYGVEHF